MENLLIQGIDKLGITHTERENKLIHIFLAEIKKWNIRFNLVKAEGNELIIRHVLDSLAGLKAIKAILDQRNIRDKMGNIRIADIGSGAGFPGLPLAIFLPHVEFTLIECSEMKAAFLRNIIVLLNLENVKVIENDIKSLSKSINSSTHLSFDAVVFRAFTPLSSANIMDIEKFVIPGGFIAAYKGKLVRIQKELKTLENKYNAIRVIKLIAPFLNEERHLVVLFLKRE